MSSLIILVFLLQFAGVSGERVFLYFRPGQDATLPCDRVSPEETQCSHISWYHQSDQTKAVFEGNQGKVCQTSARAARLRLVTGCSLIINNITAEDVGRYGCLSENTADDDSYVFLSVLTISSSAADADAQTDDRITLTCSLLRYLQVPLCPENSLQWVNETGAVLSGEGVGYELNGKKGCGSSLTVTRQSGQNRRHTCRFVERGSVKIDAEYTAVFTDGSLSYVMLALRIAGLILMMVATVAAVMIIRDRRNKKQLEDSNVHTGTISAANTVTTSNAASTEIYENVNPSAAPMLN
ncbi:uncharacterized protein LOC114428906 isoform X2 [Parambassis ranga]|uniref:Uncharacterized protein LOC114428906 isoform X2 n=1 Tax=Parambassis ranga TaxID=210632 RepID=A0A6P7HSF4_9TELE|nr:uncharacterized protein LOC114428906 isoform X2 [Parambassis ranga]